MILVSGYWKRKTTTLYSTLHELNSTEKNIVTLEDPVVYVGRINQVQIAPKIGLNFAEELKYLKTDQI